LKTIRSGPTGRCDSFARTQGSAEGNAAGQGHADCTRFHVQYVFATNAIATVPARLLAEAFEP
jgi:hypothetical protein